MKFLYLAFLVLLYPQQATDPIDKISALVGKGNIHELARSFAPSIELSMLDEMNTYSGAQAELILGRFFSQHKPLSSRLLHKLNPSSDHRLGVVLVTTAKGTFRIAFTLNDTGNTMQLIELRIENETVK